MSDTNTKFIRKYQRTSKSPWNDASTILLLADYVNNDEELELSFSSYIYLHRDEVGRIVGISISNLLLEQHPEFDKRYLDGIDMFAFLIMYIDEITEFCCLFANEFESIFLLEPYMYFEAAESRWFSLIDNA